MELLFSYGTLQQDNVQILNFGRKLSGNTDILEEYKISKIEIKDERVIRESGKNIHLILKYTGNSNDAISGKVFEITKEELLQADDYEVDTYIRVSKKLKSGRDAWIYVENEGYINKDKV